MVRLPGLEEDAGGVLGRQVGSGRTSATSGKPQLVPCGYRTCLRVRKSASDVSLLLPHRLFIVFALNVTDVRALCGFVLCDDRIELAGSRSGPMLGGKALERRQVSTEGLGVSLVF